MLKYEPPFLQVGELTLFRDHADDRTFYYLVGVPDLVVEDGKPSIWATAILPPVGPEDDEPAGDDAERDLARAILSLDVWLKPRPGSLQLAKDEIQRQWGAQAERLVPAPLHSGTASLVVVRPGGDEDDDEVQTYPAHAPTLFGANRAAFAMAADGREGQALVASMVGEHVAGVIGYELEFLGLAPAFRATMTVDWKIVYDHFQETDITNYIFVNDSVETTHEDLKRTQAVTVHIEDLSPDEEGSATRALFEEFRRELMEKLFEPVVDVGEVPVENRIAHGVRSTLTAILPGKHYQRRELEQSQLSKTTISVEEESVRAYPYNPQSTLAGLIERAGGLGDRLTWVPMDDLPHRVEDVPVELAAGSELLGVKSVRLIVQARSADGSELLAETTALFREGETDAASLRFRRQGTERPIIRYRADVTMDPGMAPRGREQWTFDWRELEGLRVWFDPQDWLDVSRIGAQVDDPAVFEVADVALEVEAWLPDEDEPFRKQHISLTAESPTAEFVVVVPEDVAPTFRGREIFRQPNLPDLVLEVDRLGSPIHRVRNPFAQRWTMELRAIADWTTTQKLKAELRVWDVVRELWLRDHFDFADGADAHLFTFRASLDTPQRAEVKVTRVLADNSVVVGPWRDLAGAVASITDDVQALRRVRVHLEVPRWAELEVRKATVEFEYANESHDIAVDERLSFRDGPGVADVVHAFPDPSHATYRVRLKVRGESGERFNGEWEERSIDDLKLSWGADASVDPWDG